MAIRLTRRRDPEWVALGRGAALFCAPATTMIVHAARARAQALFVELIEAGTVVTMAGGTIEGVPDLSDPSRARGAQDALFVVSLAELVTTDWRGILDDDDAPLTFDSAHLALLLSDHEVTDNFLTQYLHPLNQVVAEGNG